MQVLLTRKTYGAIFVALLALIVLSIPSANDGLHCAVRLDRHATPATSGAAAPGVGQATRVASG